MPIVMGMVAGVFLRFGLDLVRVLQGAFVVSFGSFTMEALVSFLVTLADVPTLNVGGAFWGLLAGLAISALLERADFSARLGIWSTAPANGRVR